LAANFALRFGAILSSWVRLPTSWSVGPRTTLRACTSRRRWACRRSC